MVKKYEPKSLKDIIGNTKTVLQIDNWIKNFKKEENKSIIINGNHGIGKTMMIKLILKLNDYYYD